MYKNMYQGIQERKMKLEKNIKGFMNDDITYHNETEEEPVEMKNKPNSNILINYFVPLTIPLVTAGTIIYTHEKSLEEKVEATPATTQDSIYTPLPVQDKPYILAPEEFNTARKYKTLLPTSVATDTTNYQ